MNNYETVILISNKITNEKRNETITKIKELISNNGDISNIEDLGEKTLAYEIKKHKKAFYYVINFASKPDFIYELERNYRIIDEVLKFIVIKKDE